MGAHLEMLAAVLVLMRRADHAVRVLLSRQGNWTCDRCSGALDSLDDLLRRGIDHLMVIGLEPDADLLSRHVRFLFLLFFLNCYFKTSL